MWDNASLQSHLGVFPPKSRPRRPDERGRAPTIQECVLLIRTCVNCFAPSKFVGVPHIRVHNDCAELRTERTVFV